MARLTIDGIEIEYELLGPAGAPAVAITPGGRFSKDATGVPELGHGLADQGLRVLLWDRPNCGASDLHFVGSGESSMQGSFLAKLVRALELGPTALIGGSAGARISLFAAKEDPGAVSRLVLWWISGGLVSLMRLGSYYCCEPAEQASLRGMEAVAAMPIWTEQLTRNPKNREIMLGQDRRAFIAQMERWAAGYIPSPDSPVSGLTKDDFARMRMPALVLRGSPNDLYHPASVCEQVHALLPNSRLVDAPWPIDVFAERMRDGRGLFRDWPLLIPQIVDFMQQ
ncbi:MAG TPA: alpha/beta hydrolase [Myxococcota bacterium]|nr:alpha/beta hydrolase [Myxococcota bacterium]